MNVLITGGGGFIGSHLAESQLARGHHVRVLDVHLGALAEAAPQPRLEFIQGDVREPELVARSLAGVEVIYHLASAHLDVRLPATEYWQTNVEAARSLMEAALKARVRRVVHCSSVGVMGTIAHPPAGEEAPLRPTNLYEQTKLAGEAVAREFATRTGLPVVVARPAWVYGPRCPRTAKLLRSVQKRRFVLFGSGQTLRHPLYVADAVQGMEACAEVVCPPGEVFILAGERVVSVEGLVRTAAEVVGVPPPRLRLPVAVGRLAGAGAEAAGRLLGKDMPFSRRSLDFFVKDNAYDTRKAVHQLGFAPQTDLRSGLAKAWRWLENHPAGRLEPRQPFHAGRDAAENSRPEAVVER